MTEIKVEHVMTHLVVTLYPEDSVQEAAQRLAHNRISGAPVVDSGRCVGVVSEVDLVDVTVQSSGERRKPSILDFVGGATAQRGHARKVADIMSTPAKTIEPEASIWKAAALLDRGGIKRLPVVDAQGHVVGIVSRADLVGAMARDDSQIEHDILDAIGVLGMDCFESLDIDVRDGVATLVGVADRRSTKKIALKLVAQVPGVIDVVDQLDARLDDSRVHVRPPEDPKDPRKDWSSSPLGS